MKRHALFVGVDNYADPTIQDLSFPSEDASDLAGAFKWSLKFDRVEKLLGPEHADDIVDAVGSMTRGLGSGDLVFFFFAGHGFRVKDNHVLVCAKDNWDDLEDEDAGLRVGRLKRKLRGPFDRMIVLDACQNDIRATRGADAGATARDLSLIHGGDAVARPGEGVQILVTSCSEGQKALEVADLRHGLFTSAFLETVRTFADGCRFLDPGILKDDLSSRMQSLAVRYRLGGMQEPMFTIPGNARIVLLDGASAPPLPHDGTPVAPTVVVCPICGKKNDPRDTFKCRECRRDNLCLRHQDEESFLCRDCTAKASAAGEAKATKEAGMAEGNPEDAERKRKEDAEAVKAPKNTATGITGFNWEGRRTQKLVERVKTVLVDTLGVSPDQVTPEASLIDDLGADDLDLIELVMALEEEFGAEIPDEDVESFMTVGDVLNWLHRKGLD